MKADYVHKDTKTIEEKPQVFTRWIDPTIEELKQENQKYKEVIDKANNWVRNYMDEWSINDETWQELNELLILLEEVE